MWNIFKMKINVNGGMCPRCWELWPEYQCDLVGGYIYNGRIRAVKHKISEAAPTSTAMTTSDTTVILGAPVGPILPATTAGHGSVGEYSVKMGEGVKGDKHNNNYNGAGNGRIQVTLCLASNATAGRRLNGQSENQKGKGEAYHSCVYGGKPTEVMTC